MKLAKMSMVAALLLGANAYAIENVKVSGDAKLYYSTDDSENATGNGGLFNKASSAGQVALDIGLTADLTEGVSAGVAMTALTAHGLENNLVSNVWESQAGLASDYWFSEAWMATTMGKTTAKVGRQTLDTPLLFTETWSIAQNTFDSFTFINQDLEDTTIVGAYVGGHNGGGAATGAFNGVVANTVQANADSRYASIGAYAAGIVNNSMKELTLQAWYYNIIGAQTNVWASADLNMDGILAGIQYATNDVVANAKAGNIMSAMVGYEMKDVATFKVAYSQTDDTVGAGANISGAGQSKVYTEMWWNYNTVTALDTTAILVSAETKVADTDLFASYVMSTNDTVAANDLNELTISASKSYGPVDTSLVFINTDREVAGVNDSGATTSGAQNMLQVYLTYNF